MLRVVATPIGNLDDFSLRAIAALREADAIACEDTRRTRILLSHYDIPRPSEMISYREGVEMRVGDRLLALLASGQNVALCTDGGYPGISDPGYRLIRAAIQAGFDLEVIPGPTAVIPALLASGLSTASFTFKGYPPRKPGPLRRFFSDEGDRPHTLILFESPMRVVKTLQAALDAVGDREAAVCLELTKRFERVHRGYLSELLKIIGDQKLKGEVTIVVAGNNPKFSRSEPAPAGDGGTA